MSIWPKAKYLLSASFLSLIVALLTFYYEVQRTKTNLVVDVLSESNVMDVRTPLKDLSILFQGSDIQKETSNLRILELHLENGVVPNLLDTNFYTRTPWGLRIARARL